MSSIPSRDHRYCGLDFTIKEIERIRELTNSNSKPNRHKLSKLVCEEFEWRHLAAGRLKDMSCRSAMLKMDRNSLIKLPLPENRNGNNMRPKLTSVSDMQPPLSLPASRLGELKC